MSERLHVALIVESSRAYGRGLLRGIARFVHTYGPWVLKIEERTLDGAAPSWLADWRGDGIIARVESEELARALLATGLPVIDVRGTRDLPIPIIDTDNREVSRQAVDHLLERGFRELAFCGYAGVNYSELRLAAFREHARERGVPFSVYESPRLGHAILSQVEQQGIEEERRLARWIEGLAKPVGLMASNDIRAQQVLSVCREINVPVPEEIGIVGVDNDELLCELSEPTLSSVENDTERIGYEAGALLRRMILEGHTGHDRIYVPPRGVVERDSTGSIAIDDPRVAQALSIIRRRISNPPDVDELARSVHVSRRTLERKFRQTLGRSPGEEILRLKIERIQELLRTTPLGLDQIATRLGFDHPEYLSVLFKRRTGMTPGQYRRQQTGQVRARGGGSLA